MTVELIPARIGHALLVARGWREGAGAVFNSDKRRAICHDLQRSNFARAVLIDGKCIAVGGEMGPLLAPTGIVWAAATDDLFRHYMAVARLAKREVQKLLLRRESLTCLIIASDELGIRFVRFLGFEIGDEKEIAGAVVREAVLHAAPLRKVA